MGYNPMTMEEIRQKILEETKEAFLENGLQNTEMKEIAKRVGIGRSTLYRYFKSKEEMMYIITLDILNDLEYRAACTSIRQNVSGWEKTHSFMMKYIDNLAENQRILIYLSEFDRAIQGNNKETLDEMQLDYLEGVRANLKRIANYIEEGKRDGSIKSDVDPGYMSNLLINTALGISQRIFVNDIIDNRGIQMAKDAVNLMLDALAV